MKIPILPKASILDITAGCLAVAVMVHPSIPVAVAFAAVVWARAAERYFVDLARLAAKALMDASTEAANASQSAQDTKAALDVMEGRLVRLETRASWSDSRRS